MPPTFLLYVAALIYLPILGTALLVGTTLLCIPRLRRTGRNLLLAAIATVPGVGIAGVVVGILGLLLVGALAIGGASTADGKLTNPLAIGLVVTMFVDAATVMFGITVVIVFGSAQIGWAIGEWFSFSRVKAWLRRSSSGATTSSVREELGATSEWR